MNAPFAAAAGGDGCGVGLDPNCGATCSEV